MFANIASAFMEVMYIGTFKCDTIRKKSNFKELKELLKIIDKHDNQCPQLTIDRKKLQIKMMDTLLANGYSWDEIFEGTGFSEVWYNVLKNDISKTES